MRPPRPSAIPLRPAQALGCDRLGGVGPRCRRERGERIVWMERRFWGRREEVKTWAPSQESYGGQTLAQPQVWRISAHVGWP